MGIIYNLLREGPLCAGASPMHPAVNPTLQSSPQVS